LAITNAANEAALNQQKANVTVKKEAERKNNIIEEKIIESDLPKFEDD
jgi:hypothetical protein